LASTAETVAKAWLNEHANETDIIKLTIRVKSSRVNWLFAGQRIQVLLTNLPGYTSLTWTRVRRRTARPVTPGFYELDLELTVPPTAGSDATTGGGAITLVQDASHRGTDGDNTVTFSVATTLNNLLVAWVSRRNLAPGGTPTGWTVLSSSVASADGKARGRAYYRLAGATTTYTFFSADGFTDTNITIWELSRAAGWGSFVAGDATLYETTSGGPSGTLSLGAVTAPAAGQQILAGWSYQTGFTPGLDATLAGGWTKDYNDGWSDDFADQSPWMLSAHWDGATSPLTASASVAASVQFCGVVVQLGAAGETPLPFVGDQIGDETPTGAVNGSNTNFTTGNPFIAGTLHVLHDGIDQTNHIATSDPIAGTYTLDYAPSAGSIIRNWYEAA